MKSNASEDKHCQLIVKWNNNGYRPLGIVLSDKEENLSESIKKKIKNKTYNKYDILLHGNVDTNTKECYLIYSEGEYYAYKPKVVFTDESDAKRFINYWNDDNGIMATGEYQLVEKVKILK